MQARRFDDLAPAPVLFLEEIPQPQPGPDEVLIRIRAIGVTPTELMWYPTTHTKTGERRSRAIPGHEFSGTVAAVGAETSSVAAGEEVFGNDWFADGATVAIAHLYLCRAWKLDEASADVTGRRQCSPNLEAILAANWRHANEETTRHCISPKPS